MPPSALDHLNQLNIAYPMLFKFTNRQKNRITHASVLEFIGDEGNIYVSSKVNLCYYHGIAMPLLFECLSTSYCELLFSDDEKFEISRR